MPRKTRKIELPDEFLEPWKFARKISLKPGPTREHPIVLTLPKKLKERFGWLGMRAYQYFLFQDLVKPLEGHTTDINGRRTTGKAYEVYLPLDAEITEVPELSKETREEFKKWQRSQNKKRERKTCKAKRKVAKTAPQLSWQKGHWKYGNAVVVTAVENEILNHWHEKHRNSWITYKQARQLIEETGHNAGNLSHLVSEKVVERQNLKKGSLYRLPPQLKWIKNNEEIALLIREAGGKPKKWKKKPSAKKPKKSALKKELKSDLTQFSLEELEEIVAQKETRVAALREKIEQRKLLKTIAELEQKEKELQTELNNID